MSEATFDRKEFVGYGAFDHRAVGDLKPLGDLGRVRRHDVVPLGDLLDQRLPVLDHPAVDGAVALHQREIADEHDDLAAGLVNEVRAVPGQGSGGGRISVSVEFAICDSAIGALQMDASCWLRALWRGSTASLRGRPFRPTAR